MTPASTTEFADLVVATAVQPRRNNTVSPGDCQVGNDTSASVLNNRNGERVYQGVWAGRFACKKSNDSQLAAGALCFTNDGPDLPNNEGRGIRGSFAGFRLDGDQCAGMGPNPVFGFPDCCDCYEVSCGSVGVLQCARYVVTGEMAPGGSAFTLYNPFVFADPVSDLETQSSDDTALVGEPPAAVQNLVTYRNFLLTCGDFAFSDIDGFGANVNFPFALGFDFDYTQPPTEAACSDRVGDGNVGTAVDRDLNGQHDDCQQVDIALHTESGGIQTTLRRRVRNMFYDGATAPPPFFVDFEKLTYGGQDLDLSDPVVATIMGDTRYEQVLKFITPEGLALVGTQNLTLTDTTPNPDTQKIVFEEYRAADLLFLGATGVAAKVTGRDLDLLETSDLHIGENRSGIKTTASPLRGMGASPHGEDVYAAIGTEIFVYTGACFHKSGLGTACVDPNVGRSIGDLSYPDTWGIAVEPDDEYAYVLAASPEIAPGGGGFAVIRRSDHTVFADPNGTTVFSSIPGTPVDVEARNFGAPGSRAATAYVTSVVLEPGDCPISGGGGGSCGFDGCHEVLPQGGMFGELELGGGEVMSSSSSGPYHRRMLLSAYDMDRPNFGLVHPFSQRAVLSCTNILDAETVEDFGLDVASDGRIFVVSPDTNQLKIVPTSSVSGVLLVNSVQTRTLGWRPTDVAVAIGPAPGVEVAVVVGTDPATGQGKMRIYTNTTNLTQFINVPGDLGIGSKPVSVTIRDDGTVAYVAAEGSGVVRLIRLIDGAILTETFPASGTLRRVVAQRTSP